MVYFQNTQSLQDNSATGTTFKNVTFNGGTSSASYTYTMSGVANNFAVSQVGTLNMAAYAILSAGSTTTSYLTLLSGSTGSASIPLIPSTSSITGYVSVQRYITGNNSTSYRGYRLLSAPVNSKGITTASTNYINFNDLNKQITIQGTTYYGAFTAGSGTGFSFHNANPVIYLNDETLQPASSTAANQSFISGKDVGISSISGTSVTLTSTFSAVNNTTQSVPVGNGYLLFYIGSTNGRPASGSTNPEANAPDSAQITYTGYLNQQNVKAYLWFAPTTGTLSYTTPLYSGSFPGGNMLGNPYPSTIYAHTMYTDNSGSIYPTIWVLQEPGQTYVSYNASSTTTQTTTPGTYIAAGQGFYVIATQPVGSFTFQEGEKVSTQLTGSSSMLAAVHPTNTLTGLHLQLTKDSIVHTQTGIYFDPSWSDAYSRQEDAIDLDGLSPKVYLSSYSSDQKGLRLSINQLSDYIRGKQVRLYVKATTDGIYKLQLADILNIDTVNYKVYLIDKKLNDSLDMVHYKSYTFNFYTADTASFANRFLLAIEPKPTNPYNLITFTGQKGSDHTIQLNWNTANEGNFTTFGLEKLGADGNYAVIDSVQSNGSGVYTFNDHDPVMGNNIYRLVQNDIRGKVSFAGPINVNYNTISVSGMFTIYPNPSKDLINIAVNSGVTGSRATPLYLASIYSLSGTVMDSRQVNTNNWTQDITGYKAGVYILELKTVEGNIIGKAKFVKTN